MRNQQLNSITLLYLLLLGVVRIEFAKCDLDSDYVQVDIDKGTLRGLRTSTWRGSPYFAFNGIPYAQPPIGELRFKGPREESPWEGVRDALEHGSVCPHLELSEVLGNEDCLFLNVYTPSIDDGPLPVMVFVHGGSFFRGSGTESYYGPDYFVGSGVVLVTLNHRLGALGFLSTEDDGAPGNAGLKDQVAALRWVQRNIARFGGDPANVTLFGFSSGGTSVHLHLLSPMSKGLFARAITHSGSALGPRWRSENIAEHTVTLARALGAEVEDDDRGSALEFLKSASFQDIIMIQNTLLTPEDLRTGVPALFLPAVETGSTSEEVFLPDLPWNIVESGNFNDVPYIIGYTDSEALALIDDLVKPETREEAFNDPERFVPRDIRDQELRQEVGRMIREFYFHDEPIAVENIRNLINVYTDIRYFIPVLRAAELHIRFSQFPIYFYRFSYDGGLNGVKKQLNTNIPGACHGDDMGYIFEDATLVEKPEIGSDDEIVQRTMTRLWTNFAKYGDPTPSGDSLTWEPATLEQFNYLDISGPDTNLAVDPDSERKKFWTEAYRENENHRAGFADAVKKFVKTLMN